MCRLLVGAPKEKSNSLKNVNETGAVYSCPITTDSADCSRMDLVTTSKPDVKLFDGISSCGIQQRNAKFRKFGVNTWARYDMMG